MKIKELKSQVNNYKNQDFDIPNVFEQIKDEAYQKEFSAPIKKRFTFKVGYAISFALVLIVALVIAIPFITGSKKSYEASDYIPKNAGNYTEDASPTPSLEPDKAQAQEPSSEYYSDNDLTYISVSSLSELNNRLNSQIKASSYAQDEKYEFNTDYEFAIYSFKYNNNTYYIIASNDMNEIKDLFDTEIIDYSNSSSFNTILETSTIYYVSYRINGIDYLLYTKKDQKDAFIKIYDSVK